MEKDIIIISIIIIEIVVGFFGIRALGKAIMKGAEDPRNWKD